LNSFQLTPAIFEQY